MQRISLRGILIKSPRDVENNNVTMNFVPLESYRGL